MQKPVVVKLSGKLLTGEFLKKSAAEVALLHNSGVPVVVVHGAGRQINARLREAGIAPCMKDGLRVTDAKTLEFVVQAVNGTRDALCSAILGEGVAVVAVEGALLAEQMQGDYGFVGNITKVDAAAIVCNLDGAVVVLSCLASDGMQAYNVNADHAAAKVAVAIGAEALVFASDVPGVFTDRASDEVLTSLDAKTAGKLISSGVVTGGMVPKVLSAVAAAEGGTEVKWVDGCTHSICEAII